MPGFREFDMGNMVEVMSTGEIGQVIGIYEEKYPVEYNVAFPRNVVNAVTKVISEPDLKLYEERKTRNKIIPKFKVGEFVTNTESGEHGKIVDVHTDKDEVGYSIRIENSDQKSESLSNVPERLLESFPKFRICEKVIYNPIYGNSFQASIVAIRYTSGAPTYDIAVLNPETLISKTALNFQENNIPEYQLEKIYDKPRWGDHVEVNDPSLEYPEKAIYLGYDESRRVYLAVLKNAQIVGMFSECQKCDW